MSKKEFVTYIVLMTSSSTAFAAPPTLPPPSGRQPEIFVIEMGDGEDQQHVHRGEGDRHQAAGAPSRCKKICTKVGRAAANMAVGSTAGATSGTVAGAIVGGALGSVVGGVGAGVGAKMGAWAGGAAGGLTGNALGIVCYDNELTKTLKNALVLGAEAGAAAIAHDLAGPLQSLAFGFVFEKGLGLVLRRLQVIPETPGDMEQHRPCLKDFCLSLLVGVPTGALVGAATGVSVGGTLQAIGSVPPGEGAVRGLWVGAVAGAVMGGLGAEGSRSDSIFTKIKKAIAASAASGVQDYIDLHIGLPEDWTPVETVVVVVATNVSAGVGTTVARGLRNIWPCRSTCGIDIEQGPDPEEESRDPTQGRASPEPSAVQDQFHYENETSSSGGDSCSISSSLSFGDNGSANSGTASPMHHGIPFPQGTDSGEGDHGGASGRGKGGEPNSSRLEGIDNPVFSVGDEPPSSSNEAGPCESRGMDTTRGDGSGNTGKTGDHNGDHTSDHEHEESDNGTDSGSGETDNGSDSDSDSESGESGSSKAPKPMPSGKIVVVTLGSEQNTRLLIPGYNYGSQVSSLTAMQGVLSGGSEQMVYTLKMLALKAHKGIPNRIPLSNTKGMSFSTRSQDVQKFSQQSQEDLQSVYNNLWTPYQLFGFMDSYETNLEHKVCSGRTGITVPILPDVYAAFAYNRHTDNKEYVGARVYDTIGSVTATSKTDGLSMAFALNPDQKGFSGQFAHCYSWGKVKTSRSVIHAESESSSKGHPDIHLSGTLFHIGYNIPLSKRIRITPYMEYVESTVCWDAYAETSGLLPCRMSKNKERLVEQHIGLHHFWDITDAIQLQTWLARVSGKRETAQLCSRPLVAPIRLYEACIPAYKKRYVGTEFGLTYDTKLTEHIHFGLKSMIRLEKAKKIDTSTIYFHIQYTY